MSKEFKYGIEGLLMAIAFFIAIKILFFFVNVSSQQQTQASLIVTDHNNTLASTKFSAGKTLFIQNCATCHSPNRILVGPALAGVTDRVPDRKLLHEWIRDNEKVLKSKDPYFTQLFIDYKKTSMNKFPNLSDEDIDAILNYVSEWCESITINEQQPYLFF